MFGTILGDIIGSPYEFDMGNKSKDFPFFDKGCGFTDDTVMTIAVAQGLMETSPDADDQAIKDAIIDAMHTLGAKYPDVGYGARFYGWVHSKDRNPYNSFGNGSAMRVSATGWMAETLEDARRLARLSAEVTHNHLEGIKGAEATASAIFLARQNCTKEEIKDYIVKTFNYDLSRTCDEIRPDYYHVESCQQTVPEAITAFLEGEDFEDVIRTAVSLGGDCDTLTAIAGSIAEAFYGVPVELKLECYGRLDDNLRQVLLDFEARYMFAEKTACKYHPLYWFGRHENGIVQLERPFSKPKVFDENTSHFAASEQALEGWQRARLYQDAFGVWDATAFEAMMSATLAYGPFVNEETGEEYRVTFTTPQEAERKVYPYLSQEQVQAARDGVELFYSDPLAQMKWQGFILRPVAIAVTKEGAYHPLWMSQMDPNLIDFKDGQTVEFANMK